MRPIELHDEFQAVLGAVVVGSSILHFSGTIYKSRINGHYICK